MDHILINFATLSLLFTVSRLEAVKNEKFCIQNPNNTLCVYPDDTPGESCENYVKRTLTNSEKRDVISWHVENGNDEDNKSRGGIRWDPKLASMAQIWAAQCTPTKDSNRHFGNNSVEQNIFRVKDTSETYTVGDVLDTSDDWKRTLRKWRTFSVGCGGSTYSAGGDKYRELVCNYVVMNENRSSSGIEKREETMRGKKNETEEEEDEDYDEFEDPFDVKELEMEIDRRIDEEFGPFKGFLESTEGRLYPTAGRVGAGLDLRVNKYFEEFEKAGASITSKGKYVLWAMRDDATALVPNIYAVIASSTIIFIYHLLTII